MDFNRIYCLIKSIPKSRKLCSKLGFDDKLAACNFMILIL